MISAIVFGIMMALLAVYVLSCVAVYITADKNQKTIEEQKRKEKE